MAMCLPQYCRVCEVLPACNGDCPKHRFAQTPDGEAGLSYLCRAYKAVFNHMAPCMTMMAELVQTGRRASEIMGALSSQGVNRRSLAPGRNTACPCGSGKKFKRCCGA